ncbi:MAG: carbohydrate ABC transporter permease [Candidatus Humimicrobiaceae bacterium]
MGSGRTHQFLLIIGDCPRTNIFKLEPQYTVSNSRHLTGMKEGYMLHFFERDKQYNKDKIYSQYFIIIGLLIYTIFFMVPSIISIGYSLTDWNAYRSDVNFIGLKNFREIFVEGDKYLKYISNTIIFAVVTTAFKILFGLILALILNEAFKTKNILRAIFYLPVTLSPLAIGLMFTSVFKPNVGLVNRLLSSVGLDNLTRNWLSSIQFAMPAVMSVETWRLTGYCMVIFLAGLQTIPQDLYEAAKVDGANYWQRVAHLTIPFLKPSFVINIVLNLIWGLKVFDIIFALTRGGPGDATGVINTAVFFAYSMGRYGFSTALGVVVFIIAMLVSFAVIKILSRREVEW